jgi:DNA-binding transcriptional LysR family regulator
MIDNKHSAGMALHSRMLAINLQHLRYAVAARDQGSLRRAAESLSVQQSTLSRCIRQLEHSIGMTIFLSIFSIQPVVTVKRLAAGLDRFWKTLELGLAARELRLGALVDFPGDKNLVGAGADCPGRRC